MNIRWKTWLRRVSLHLNGTPASAKREQPPALPPRLWGARRITIALEPPVQGRNNVILEARFCCAPALSFAESFYREVRQAICDSHDWELLEGELRMLIGQRGYNGLLFVIFMTTDDVFFMSCLNQDRLLLHRVVGPPLRQIATMQMGSGGSADTLFALVDPGDFARIFAATPPAPPRAVVSL